MRRPAQQPDLNGDHKEPRPCRKRLSGWQLIENRAMLLCDEGSLQTYWLDGRRSAPVADSA